MKTPQEIQGNPIFDEILASTNGGDKIFISKSLEISSQIISVMEEQGIKQKDLASKLGKTEAEISKWLSGFHNFTLKTISKIEFALGAIIITTPEQVDDEINQSIENIFISEKNKHIVNMPAFSALNKIPNEEFTTSHKGKIIDMPIKTNFIHMAYTSDKKQLTGTFS